MRDGWAETTLGDVVRIQKGKKPPSLLSDGRNGAPYLTAEVLRGARPSQFIEISKLSECVELAGDETVILWDGAGAGDIFLARSGVLASTMAKAISKDAAQLHPAFLYIVLLARRDEIKSSCRGTTVPHVSPDSLKDLVMSVPPIHEQKRIVDVVASVDAYIDALQQHVDAARTARNAVLHELLTAGGPDWTETTLGTALEISRGGSPRPIHDYITSDGSGVNWIKIGDASAGSKYIFHTAQKIRPEGVSMSRRVFPGDFLLSNSMSFGRPYIMRTEGCIHDGWLLLGGVERLFDEDFLFNVLMSGPVQDQFESLAAGSGVRNLNIDVAGRVRVPLPPMPQQREIGGLANSMDDVVQSAERAISDAKSLRSGLLSSLLSGEHEIPASYDSLLGVA